MQDRESDAPAGPVSRARTWPALPAIVRRSRRQRLWLILGVAGVVVVLSALLWRTASQPRDRFWERIQATGQWRVAMDPSFPPFESLDASGQPVGFDVDLAQAIADRWGVRAQFEGIGFDGLIDAVWASKVDSVISALPVQPQFSKDVAFSQPYFEAGIVVVASAADAAVRSTEDLANRRVAVEWGSEGDVQARALRRRFPDLQIDPMETAQAALQAVADGKADVAFVDHISALQFQADNPSIRLVMTDGAGDLAAPLVLSSEPYVVATPRKAPILQKQVGEALEALQADGTLQALMQKWFGAAQ